MRNQNVRTKDCALAIALPLSEAEFREDLRRGGHYDFAQSILRRNSSLSEDGAWRLYAPTAATVQRIAKEVEVMGVRVSYRTSLSELTLLLHYHPVVTLATHCCLIPIREEDILDPEGLELMIRTDSSADGFEKDVKTVLSRAIDEARRYSYPERELRWNLTCAMNAVVNQAHAWYERSLAEPRSARDSTDSIAHRITRAELEFRFPEFLSPGRCVELRDGLCTIPELADTVPDTYTGVFDLSLCNSAILERRLKATRPQCLLVVNQGLADIDARMLRYKLVIVRLLRSPVPFVEALRDVHLALKGDSA